MPIATSASRPSSAAVGKPHVYPSTERPTIWSASACGDASASRSSRRTPSHRALPSRPAADLVRDAGQGDVGLDDLAFEQLVERQLDRLVDHAGDPQTTSRSPRPAAPSGRCRSGRSRRWVCRRAGSRRRPPSRRRAPRGADPPRSAGRAPALGADTVAARQPTAAEPGHQRDARQAAGRQQERTAVAAALFHLVLAVVTGSQQRGARQPQRWRRRCSGPRRTRERPGVCSAMRTHRPGRRSPCLRWPTPRSGCVTPPRAPRRRRRAGRRCRPAGRACRSCRTTRSPAP